MQTFDVGMYVKILHGKWQNWVGKIVSIYVPGPDLPDSKSVAQVEINTRQPVKIQILRVPVILENLVPVNLSQPF